MKIIKTFAAVAAAFSFCCVLTAQAQDSESKTVESEYMSNSTQDVVISELANSPDRENKMVALNFLEQSLEDGKATPAMVQALDQLAGEGISTQSRINGRMMNNFPDIRAKACEILGKVGTEDAALTLNKVVKYDNEPMVLSSAIRALGDIGYNDGDKISDTIAFISNRVETLTPSSSMALEVVIAYEKLLPNIKNKKPVIDSLGRIATDSNLVRPVRTRAMNLLKQMRNSGSSSNKQ